MSDSKPFTPPLFVINLERSSDRRASIAAQLEEIDIDFEIFPASDGARLLQSELTPYDEKFVIGQIARPLSRSEVGCYLSHTRLWKKIVEEEIPWAVVLEDDVDIHANLTDILAAIGNLPFKWDFIRLAGLGPTPSLPLFNLTDEFNLSVLLQGAGGTQAYCVGRTGAQKLLDYSLPRIRGTIDDHVIDNCWKTGLRILAVQPYPISENKGFVSSIQTERRQILHESRKKTEKMGLRRWAVRTRYKFGRSMGRRAYILIHSSLWLEYRTKRLFKSSK